MHGLAVALCCMQRILAYHERNPAEVERLASDLIELSTRHQFCVLAGAGDILRGWARSASGDTAEGISWIEDGIERLSGNRCDAGLAIFPGTKG